MGNYVGALAGLCMIIDWNVVGPQLCWWLV